MTPFSAVIGGVRPVDGGFAADIPEDWRQGRTAYGGISAALCLAVAGRAVPDLPPLRSAQFAFIGPAAGEVRLRAAVLRRGRSAVFVGVDLHGEAGLATHATLCFGAARGVAARYEHVPVPNLPPRGGAPAPSPGERAPQFLQHFEMELAGGAGPGAGAAVPEILLWMRHRDMAATDIVALVALADGPPPAALSTMQQMAPISTMTWMLDVLGAPRGGWHLVRSAAETVAEGYSAQTLTVWAEDGTPLLASRQMVAIFG